MLGDSELLENAEEHWEGQHSILLLVLSHTSRELEQADTTEQLRIVLDELKESLASHLTLVLEEMEATEALICAIHERNPGLRATREYSSRGLRRSDFA